MTNITNQKQEYTVTHRLYDNSTTNNARLFS